MQALGEDAGLTSSSSFSVGVLALVRQVDDTRVVFRQRLCGFTGCTGAYGRRNEFRRNPPLRRRDGEGTPLAGHALEPVSAAVFELGRTSGLDYYCVQSDS